MISVSEELQRNNVSAIVTTNMPMFATRRLADDEPIYRMRYSHKPPYYMAPGQQEMSEAWRTDGCSRLGPVSNTMTSTEAATAAAETRIADPRNS